MFEMFSNVAGLMKNAHLLQSRAQEFKQKLAEARVEAVSQGNLVRVVASGELKLVSITIDPQISSDVRLVEQLVLEASNTALGEARKIAAQEMAALTDGLGVPGLSQVMSRFGIGAH